MSKFTNMFKVTWLFIFQNGKKKPKHLKPTYCQITWTI